MAQAKKKSPVKEPVPVKEEKPEEVVKEEEKPEEVVKVVKTDEPMFGGAGDVVTWDEIVKNKAIRDGKVVAKIKLIVTSARVTYGKLQQVPKEEWQPLMLPEEKGIGNNLFVIMLNGVKLTLKKGYLYYLPPQLVAIANKHIHMPKRMKKEAEAVAKSIDPAISTDISELN